MTNRKNNFLTLGLAILLAAAISFYVYKDLHKTSNQPLTQPENSSQNQPISIETTGRNQNYQVSLENLPSKPKTALSAIKMPDLSLPVVNYNHVDSSAFEIMAKNINILGNELKKDSQNESKWLNLAIFRKMTGDYQTAAKILNYAATLWPNDYVPANNLADLYQFYLKNYPLAEKNWLKVIALKPDYTEAYENLYNLYAISYKEKQAEALPTLLKGLANSPNSIDLMVYIARYYRGAGSKDMAATYYTKALNEAHSEKNQQLETSLRSETAEMDK